MAHENPFLYCVHMLFQDFIVFWQKNCLLLLSIYYTWHDVQWLKKITYFDLYYILPKGNAFSSVIFFYSFQLGEFELKKVPLKFQKCNQQKHFNDWYSKKLTNCCTKVIEVNLGELSVRFLERYIHSKNNKFKIL